MVSCQKLTVEFANVDTKIQMEQWAREIDRPDLQELVFETLKEDPRPLAYLKNGHNYNNQHKLRVYNGQIHFMVQDDKVIIYQVDSTMDAYKDRR
jgi:mRNA-degrading endonuclease RelE of RelBE toxin-antitoxin system